MNNCSAPPINPQVESFNKFVLVQGDEQIPKLALRPKDAAIALSIGETKLMELARAGQIPCVTLAEGKNKALRIFPVDGLRNWLNQQAEPA